MGFGHVQNLILQKNDKEYSTHVDARLFESAYLLLTVFCAVVQHQIGLPENLIS